MDSYLKRFLEDRKNLVSSMLVTLAMVSAYFSYKGAVLFTDAGGVSWIGRSSAVVYAFGIGIAIYTFWTLAFRVVPSLPAGRFRYLGMCITAAGCGFLVALSSWLNVAGLAGAAALELHMYQAIATYQEAVDETYGKARRSEQLLPDLRAASKRFETLGLQELNHGKITGSPGPGTVEQTLRDIAAQLGGLAGEIELYVAASEAVASKARGQLESMRRVVGKDAPPAVRMRSLSRESDALRASLQEMAGMAPEAGIQRVVDTLAAGVTLQPVSGRNKAVAKRQREALEMIEKLTKETAATLGTLAAGVDGPDDPEGGVLAFPWIGPVKAVSRYAGDLVPMWAGGIALDLVPTVVILFLMLAFSVHEESTRPRDRFRDITLLEMEEALEAADRLRRPRPPSLPGK